MKHTITMEIDTPHEISVPEKVKLERQMESWIFDGAAKEGFRLEDVQVIEIECTGT